MSISVTHKLGTFLCPRFKSLKMFQAEERNDVYERARRLVREFDSALLTPPASLREPSREPDPNQPMPRVDDEAERVKRKRDAFSEWEDESEVAAEKDEVQRYIEGQFFWDGEDILQFWQSQSISFPVLSKLPKIILYAYNNPKREILARIGEMHHMLQRLSLAVL
ncbi:hypothetical protein DPEC_G00302970 [Dallia pectoralis]|uniref:Uncharacterized protein n=1 Tax=Dallia pectoralis TaxID=75939 RepID=A0ACC2FH39_DALPE|nr:hypothetical protein DPEC_G00302970 [Dallia pectoralis]